MQKPLIPDYEKDRMCAVMDLKILDTDTEERFDKITREATERFGVPISTITVIDKDREWYKSMQGLTQREGPRETSFCAHALLHEELYIIEDTLKDPLFADNPMVIGEPFIRFYAGKSLRDAKTHLPVGVFCVKGIKPRVMNLGDISAFLELANRAEEEINRK